MTSREKVFAILNRTNSGKPGYWTGNPHEDTFRIYFKELGITTAEELYTRLGDDCRWLPADGSYRNPNGGSFFSSFRRQNIATLSEGGIFEGDVTLADIEKADWPDVKYLNFDRTIARIRQHPDKSVFTGFWSCFYHDIMGFFGMEEYFIKMISEPEIVEAATEHVIDFLCAANDLFFTALGDDADTFFFGNDFGTQLSTMISPELFKKFVLPGTKRLIDVAKKHNKKVILHSCGCIYEFIPLLIDAGIDGLHPLQAKAVNMDAATLSREFGKDLAFMGGIDTQELLMYDTPEQIKTEVRRVRSLLGPNLIVSPSHEAILPNVPLANVIAMSEAAKED
jgi:uroporphyrinogen decarboxylase